MPEREEVVALVDETGCVVGSAPRSRMRAENLRHGATAVVVRDSARRIFVHRRSDAKDWCPAHHDAAAGGVLKAGEDPEGSALRELAEELGITGTPLRRLGTSLFEDATVRVFEHCFEVTWDGDISFADGEVLCGQWMELAELGARLRDPSWPFVPDTRALLDRLAADRIGDYPGLDPAGRSPAIDRGA